VKFLLTPSFNDGKNDPPPTEVDLGDKTPPGLFDGRAFDELADFIYGELTNDNGDPFGVGFTLKIERIA
jgi:hypothetical protein